MNRMNPKVNFYFSKAKKLGTAAAKLVSVLNYDGMPITANNIFRQIKGRLHCGV
jgi:hypothetical protein